MSFVSRIENTVVLGIEKWGEKAQTIKAAEECCELAVQLCKMANNSPTSIESIVDEIADVMIMTYSMRQVFGKDTVDARIAYKLDRIEKAVLKL